MFCNNCGAEISEASRFCQNCGSAVSVETPFKENAPQFDSNTGSSENNADTPGRDAQQNFNNSQQDQQNFNNTQQSGQPNAAQGQGYNYTSRYDVPAGQQPASGMATACLVLGILGLVLSIFIPILPVVLSIIGIVLYVTSGKSGNTSGVRTAGLVLNIIALVIGIIVLIAFIIGIIIAASAVSVVESLNPNDINGISDGLNDLFNSLQ